MIHNKLLINMRRFLVFGCVLLSIILACPAVAADPSSSRSVGVRLGFWSALQANELEVLPGEEVLTKVTRWYGEIHFSAGLRRGFAVGVSLGSYYRGETRYNDPNGYYWKKVTIYPLTGELKYYPIYRSKKSRLQPYLDLGLAIVSGIEDLRFGEYAGPLLLLGQHTNSYLTLGWHVGAGLDFALSRVLSIGADFKYRWVRFGDNVGGMKDYSGPQATVGLSYILGRL